MIKKRNSEMNDNNSHIEELLRASLRQAADSEVFPPAYPSAIKAGARRQPTRQGWRFAAAVTAGVVVIAGVSGVVIATANSGQPAIPAAQPTVGYEHIVHDIYELNSGSASIGPSDKPTRTEELWISPNGENEWGRTSQEEDFRALWPSADKAFEEVRNGPATPKAVLEAAKKNAALLSPTTPYEQIYFWLLDTSRSASDFPFRKVAVEALRNLDGVKVTDNSRNPIGQASIKTYAKCGGTQGASVRYLGMYFDPATFNLLASSVTSKDSNSTETTVTIYRVDEIVPTLPEGLNLPAPPPTPTPLR